MDSPTTIISHWTTPDSIHDTVNDANDTSPQLVVSSAVTADSGDYTCSVRVTHSSGSLYILDSPLTSDSVNITISKYSKISVIRASVDALCRDGTSEISRDPRTKHIQTRRESLARPSEHTNNF